MARRKLNNGVMGLAGVRPELLTSSRAYTEYSFFVIPSSLPKEHIQNVDFETPSQNRNTP